LDTNVSEDLSAFNIIFTLKMGVSRHSETLASYHITTRCHSLEDYDLKFNCVASLTCGIPHESSSSGVTS